MSKHQMYVEENKSKENKAGPKLAMHRNPHETVNVVKKLFFLVVQCTLWKMGFRILLQE